MPRRLMPPGKRPTRRGPRSASPTVASTMTLIALNHGEATPYPACMRNNITDRLHALAKKRKLTKWIICASAVRKSREVAREIYAHSTIPIARGPRQDITPKLIDYDPLLTHA